MPVSGEGSVDSTRAGRVTRAALIRAAWELVDEMPLHELLSAVRVEDVVAEAGVTTGAFFHHFASRQQFVDAMVEDLLLKAHDRASLEELGALESIDAGETGSDLRNEAESFLSMVDHAEGARTLRRMLLLWSRSADDLIGDATLGALLTEHYWEPAEATQREIWRLVLNLAERYPLAPFDRAAMTLVMEALGTGFLVRRLAAPELFTIELFADVVMLLISTMSTPISGTVTLAEMEVGLGEVMTMPATDQAMHQREVAANYASRLDEGWETCSFTELAGLVPDGPTATELAAMFGGVRRLAAFAFYTVLEPVAWFVDRDFERDPPPRREAIAAIVLAARAHPSLARAHSLERARDTTRFGLTHSEGDVRLGVSLESGIIRAHLNAMADHSVTVRQVVEAVTAVVDAALVLGLRPELDVDLAIESTIAMLPEGTS